MTSKEKIIKFMEKKQEVLARHSKKRVYFGVKDKRDIEKWPDKRCDAIWEGLTRDGYYGAGSCPFCLYLGDEECSECSYGKRHGICGDWHSSYYYLFSARNSVTMGERMEIEEFVEKLEEKQNG